MNVTVKLFALARDRAGAPSVPLELPPGATVAALKKALGEAVPALAPLLPSLMIALNAEYATDDQAVPDGAEIAAIPPVSGGSPLPDLTSKRGRRR